jgi:NAD(P)-dependent dehydrogenase (short-subunit alcohol dehydrogenase family)
MFGRAFASSVALSSTAAAAHCAQRQWTLKMDEGPSKVCCVVGVGPNGTGQAVAEKFASEGYQVALMARSEDTLKSVKRKIEAAGGTAVCIPCDVTKEESIHSAFDDVRKQLGNPDVLVYNCATYTRGGALAIRTEEFLASIQTNCIGAFHCTREVLPYMTSADSNGGTILLTGATASVRGGANFSGYAPSKFCLRGLSQSLAREFGPQDVHVAHVIVDGLIDTTRVREWFPDKLAHELLQPKAIADTFWQLHQQDRTCWTQELDIRPAVEQF